MTTLLVMLLAVVLSSALLMKTRQSLWDIAAHYFGDPFAYPELARLSRIRNPDLIYPGDIIRIIKKHRPAERQGG